MNIILKLPPLVPNELNLRKINANVYEQLQTHKFYRLSFHPQATLFKHQDLIMRKISILTPYDPYFLLIQFITDHRKGPISQIPANLSHLKLDKLAFIQGGQYKVSDQKVKGFIEKKLQKLSLLIRQKQLQGTMIMKIKKQNNIKELSKSAIDLMRVEIPQYWYAFLDQLAEATENNRKMVLPTYNETPNPKREQPKSKSNKKVQKPIVNINEHQNMMKWIKKSQTKN